MDEATAYQWAGQVLRPLDGIIEPHKGQQVADLIVSALMEATRPLEIQRAYSCACGADLEISPMRRPSDDVNIYLLPCVFCLQAENERAYHEGSASQFQPATQEVCCTCGLQPTDN